MNLYRGLSRNVNLIVVEDQEGKDSLAAFTELILVHRSAVTYEQKKDGIARDEVISDFRFILGTHELEKMVQFCTDALKELRDLETRSKLEVKE